LLPAFFVYTAANRTSCRGIPCASLPFYLFSNRVAPFQPTAPVASLTRQVHVLAMMTFVPLLFLSPLSALFRGLLENLPPR
jgi:hypothetical protein